MLIAALLELKSRLMLPSEDEEGVDLEPQEAAEELLARMLEYHRYRGAAEHLRERLAAEHGYRYWAAPLLALQLRRVSIEVAEAAYDLVCSPRRSASSCACRRRSTRACCAPAGRVGRPAARAPAQPAAPVRARFSTAVEGADRLTEAVTLFALLELYKAGEVQWEQEVPFGPITVMARS